MSSRFRRRAQIITRDGMYAGFAGAKTVHYCVTFRDTAVGIIKFQINALRVDTRCKRNFRDYSSHRLAWIAPTNVPRDREASL